MFTPGMLTFSAAGRVQLALSGAAVFTGGVPMTIDGRLVIAAPDGVAPTSYLNGLGLVGNALATDSVNAPSIFVNGTGYVANGGLAIDAVSPITSYSSGMPRTATGALATDPTVNP
jgi:hypothetical protein